MRKITTISIIFAGAAALCACQTAQQAGAEEMFWIRADGQKSRGNPQFEREAQTASTICDGEVAKAAASMGVIYSQGLIGALQTASIQSENQQRLMVVYKGCMAEHGYLLVPKSSLPKA